MPTSESQRVGTIAEIAFMRQCLERNFEPHPTTTPMPWDYLVTSPSGTHKVQVKATSKLRNLSGYKVVTSKGLTNKTSLSDDIDVVACYVLPVDVWWIIPREGIGKSKTVNLSPSTSSTSKYKKYQDNWSMFYK